jgi:UDP:flavonoid glycosyltransferase YjiC (YdhE family)
MARFLFVTQPITGHLLPALPIVRALVERGHAVAWYAGARFQAQIEAVGAQFAPYQTAYDYDDRDYNAAFPGRNKLAGLAQIRFDFINLFMKQIGAQHHDLANLLATFPADVTVGDPSIAATFTLNELGGPPNAVYNITCLGIKGRDVAPFGLGMLPNGSRLGRIRNQALGALAARVIFKAVSDELGRQRTSLGVPPQRFEGVLLSRYLFLEPSVPAFEYPRSDLPPQVHYIGALLPDPPDRFTPPAWWGEVIGKQRPVVLVTQGTVATDSSELIGPALQGLAQEDVLVIAAGVTDPAQLGLNHLPANVRVERFVPFKPLLPYVDVYVTNGGFGGVQYALANGVPIIAAGTTEDKPEIANRVAYSGVGINLRTNRPTPAQIRAAVRQVLRHEQYRAAARRAAADLASHDAPHEAVGLLEQLAASRQPVYRGQSGASIGQVDTANAAPTAGQT